MSPSTSPHPRIGVAVFILHPSDTPISQDPSDSNQAQSSQSWKFLLGKRLGSHGAGTWALPGGHLDFGESFEECAVREVQEETGLDVEGVKFLTATNDVMLDEKKGDDRGKHYVTIFMTARVKVSSDAVGNGGMPEAQLLEPDKCAGWEWVSWVDFVAWAQPQINMLEERNGEGVQSKGEMGEVVERRILFSPMVALLVQRPDAIPSLA
ncbi:hypothetical protein H2200_000269 [Cladophialophora chaetospira]|uniref:Nudix hydrolase domain-containing protein n=1 Tax=Cladophialophora chaetospira TaxID=386627 RepID=A0AA38XN36_9EURO|nr:hypothetical protein H2200_000269 [Cladophialophora chaetospira]